MSFFFSLFISQNSVLKTAAIEIDNYQVITPGDAATTLGIDVSIVPTSVSINGDNTEFKNGTTTLFTYTYVSNPDTQSITIGDNTYAIMLDPFLWKYSLHSDHLFAENPTFLSYNDNGQPPTLAIDYVKNLDSDFGTGDIQFKIRVENVSVTNTTIDSTADEFRRYSFEIENSLNTINMQYLTENTITENVFHNKTPAQINNLTLSSLDADIVYVDTTGNGTNNERQLSIVLNDGGSITIDGTGGVLGDPHIQPIFGKIYELPNTINHYRMVEGKDLIINSSYRYFTSQEKTAIRNYYYHITLDMIKLQHLITDGVVQHKTYIQCEDITITYDYDTKQGTMSHAIEHFSKNYSDGKSIIFKLPHSTYGTVLVECRHYVNPQVFSGMFVNMKRKVKKCIGLLIRNYRPESFIVTNIKDTASKRSIAKDAVYYEPPISIFKNAVIRA